MAKIKHQTLKNWMGEDWTLTYYTEDDLDMRGLWGTCEIEQRRIHMRLKGQTGDYSTLIHEVMHRCFEQHNDNDENPITELRVEWASNCMVEFLRKMGVDLSPLIPEVE